MQLGAGEVSEEESKPNVTQAGKVATTTPPHPQSQPLAHGSGVNSQDFATSTAVPISLCSQEGAWLGRVGGQEWRSYRILAETSEHPLASHPLWTECLNLPQMDAVGHMGDHGG